jgi:lysophospholipase L1-like esterase
MNLVKDGTLTRVRLPRAKYVMCALAAVGLSTLLALGGLLALDIYLHRKFEDVAGLNIWGYRGRVTGRKLPGERRVVVVGGSTAFGYGVRPYQAFPALLEAGLNDPARGLAATPISVVNLAGNNEGAYSFVFTLQSYRYLDYDVAILYEGYNDASVIANRGFRQDSPVFRLTGYYPIFPIILREKAMILRAGGELEKAYWGEKTVFRPNVAGRASATALETAASMSESLERQLGRLSPGVPPALDVRATDCEARFEFYCRSVQRGVDWLLAHGKRAMIVTQPYVSDAHVAQQRALVGMLTARYAGNGRVRYVNAGPTVNLRDPLLAWDGMHLTARGNEMIAARLTPEVVEMLW